MDGDSWLEAGTAEEDRAGQSNVKENERLIALPGGVGRHSIEGMVEVVVKVVVAESDVISRQQRWLPVPGKNYVNKKRMIECCREATH